MENTLDNKGLNLKNILVPTDFSNCANAAADYAIQLAQLAGAEVHLLHLQETPVNWIRLSKEKEKRYPETLRAIGHAKSELSKWVRKAEKTGVKAERFLVFDTGKDEIIRHLEAHQHDFLVMGSHGADGLEEKLIGSNAQQVLRQATVPVLIIKKPIFRPVRNILFVSDFTDVSTASFHQLTGFADLIQAHIDLLFVNTPDQFTASAATDRNMDRLMAHCQREDTCTRNVINAETVEDGIKAFIRQQPMDLIAICTHGKSGLRQLFSPSIAEKVANRSILPVLSLRL
jgi:nucleotide-binding universal stress UspA family protein